jgi:hypothetical protein
MKHALSALVLRGLPFAAWISAALLSSCAGPYETFSWSAGSASARVAARPEAALGTGWGERRDSHVTSTTFQRASSKPDGVGQLHYTRASQLGRSLSPRTGSFRGPVPLASGLVEVGIKSSHSRWLRGEVRHGRTYIIGEPGERYEISLRNLTYQPLEVVVSVDGLDVLDGRSASFAKRGHLIGPRDTVTISGWRTSTSSVAAFRFADAGDSYAAQKHGDTRNVGVIGVAAFKGRSSPLVQFATPPPGRRTPNPFPGE